MATNDGHTPLRKCSREGHLELARLLLARGAKGNATATESQVLAQTATSQGHHQLGAWLGERAGWAPLKYACEAGWAAWSPSTHEHFPPSFRKAVVALLPWSKLGKDVLLQALSYCGWDWFEREPVEEGIGHRVSKRRKTAR